jgi:hypothetical protein
MYIRLLIPCHLHPIWPPVLPLNLTSILKFLPLLPWANLPYTYFWHSMYQISCPFSFAQVIYPRNPRPLLNVRNRLIFYGVEVLAPRPTPKLEDHLLPAVRDCSLNIFAGVLHNWWASPPSATWGCTMMWWQGTHLTWFQTLPIIIWIILMH